MSNLVTINNTALSPIEFRGERVLTFKMIDSVHVEKPTNGLVTDSTYSKSTVSKSKAGFNRNRTHFIHDEDYFHASMKEARQLVGVHSPNGLTLLTESGYLMLVKTFTDDLAWKIQKQLVRSYFRAKDLEVPVQQEIVMHQPEVVKPSDLAQMQQAMIAMTTGLTASMAKMADSMAHIAQAMQHNAVNERQELPRVDAPYAIGESDLIIMEARNMNMAMQELSKVIQVAGGQTALAARLGVKNRQVVYAWIRSGRVPGYGALKIKQLYPWVNLEALLSNWQAVTTGGAQFDRKPKKEAKRYTTINPNDF